MKKLLTLFLCFVLSLSFNSKAQTLQNKVYSNGLMPSSRSGADASSAYNTWKTNLVVSCSNGRYRVEFDDRSQTVSEGIGYGMLLSAYASDKTLFDGLWNYYKDNRNGNGVMNWKIGGCSGVVGANGATDADEDAAMALIVAHNVWGSSGSINYQNDAKTLIAAIKSKEVESGSFVLKPGDQFGGSSNTNPSYFAPGYYRTFGAFTNDASFWNSVASKTYSIINANLSTHNAVGGLVSDWCQANGAYSQGQTYSYDACRTPWRIAVDYAWYGTSDAKTYIQKSSDFVRVNLGGTKNVKDGYNQNGSVTGQWHNSPFVGGFACAAIGGGNQSHLDASYADLNSINDANSYFNQSLKTLYLFFLTGNFYLPGGSTNPPPSNVAPTVSITSPSNNASFNAGSNISISANATDSDGSITKVDFYQGSTLIGSDASSPYSVTWNNVASGSYAITAKATDNAGAVTTSSVVNITVNTVTTGNVAPSVNITSPSNNATFSSGANITITANATDSDGSISKVDFYQGSTLLGSDASSPYSFTWNNVAAGSYSITAKATDNAGAVTTSSVVNITVNTVTTGNVAPSVNITSPSNNATFTAGANISITANATDSDGSVSKVDFYQGSTLLGSDASSPYSFTWNNVAAGTYSLTAKATDNSGAVTTSASVSITVNPVSTGGGTCVTEAIPTASDWIVRNDWSDQNNGSVVTNESSALKFTHRQWGESFAWLIEANKTVSIVSGRTYTIKFDFLDDPNNHISSINVGLASNWDWAGPVLTQSAVTAPSGYSSSSFTTKTVTINATSTQSVHLALKLIFNSQPNLAVNDYIKNISICESTSLRMAVNVSATASGSSLYPNPFENSAKVLINAAETVPLKIKISDSSGKLMFESSEYVTNETAEIGNDLPQGIYILQGYYSDKVVTFKFVKN